MGKTLTKEEQKIYARAYRDAIRFAIKTYNKWDFNDPSRKMPTGMFKELTERITVCNDALSE